MNYGSLVASAEYSGDSPSLTPGRDAETEPVLCAWCRELLTATRTQRFCTKKCRQAAFRLRRRRATDASHDRLMHFRYADPPYPGRAKKYYGQEPSYGGEVDHVALIASLEGSGADGWALSTAADALRRVLPLCPEGARVCAWVKPIGACPLTAGLHNTWEPLIVVRGRQRRPGKRDWLSAQPARFGGDLPGRKPIAFIAWLWECLGAQPGDTIDDLFPGTGVVGRAWAELSRAALSDAAVVHADGETGLEAP
jgi:hypothetical protein